MSVSDSDSSSFGFISAIPTLTSDDVVHNDPEDVAFLRTGKTTFVSDKPMLGSR
jgi:hypothetical protein